MYCTGPSTGYVSLPLTSNDITANENGNKSFIAQWSPVRDDQRIYPKFLLAIV